MALSPPFSSKRCFDEYTFEAPLPQKLTLFRVCAFGAKIKIINYLNLIKIPQKPDFAESEESGDKTKEQTQFVLS